MNASQNEDDDSDFASDGERERVMLMNEDLEIQVNDDSDLHLDTQLEDYDETRVIKKKKIQFQGITFDLKVSRTTPIEVLDKTRGALFAPLIKHLNILQQNDRFTVENQGQVLYADDQFIN